MGHLSEFMPYLNQFMTLVEKQFGSRCEVVLNGLEEEGKSRIADIRNGHVTGRSRGGDGGSTGLEVSPGDTINGDRYNYITTIRDGKILRSSTIYLRDEAGKPMASLSVNLDITKTLQMESFLRQYNRFDQAVAGEDSIDFTDVNGLLERLIQKGQQKIGKPAAEMNKVEKVEFIRYLDEKGAFLITKSGEKICELLEISKFTFYSYLEKSRNAGEAEED